LITKQENNTKQSANIDTQVADLERIVQANRDRMIASFIAMESAQGPDQSTIAIPPKPVRQLLQFLEVI
jgi:hypothetical protein